MLIGMSTFHALITTFIKIWGVLSRQLSGYGEFYTTLSGYGEVYQDMGSLITTFIRIWGGWKPSEPGLSCHWEPGQEKLGPGRYHHHADATNDDHDADDTNDDDSPMIDNDGKMYADYYDITLTTPSPRLPRPFSIPVLESCDGRRKTRSLKPPFHFMLGICRRGSSAHIYCSLNKDHTSQASSATEYCFFCKVNSPIRE